MCGRVVVASPVEVLAGFLGVADTVVGPWPPRWNVSPGSDLLTVASTRGGRRLGTMRWGLVPSWSGDGDDRPRPINARVESLTERAMFAEPLARRRCLVVVDGFYEWRRPPGGRKQPYLLDRADGSGEPLALAALWDRNRGEVSCAIVTGPADDGLDWLHDRMPVRVAPDDWDEWLDPANHDVDALLRLLRRRTAVALRARPVPARVNDARNEGPDLVEVVAGEAQARLL